MMSVSLSLSATLSFFHDVVISDHFVLIFDMIDYHTTGHNSISQAFLNYPFLMAPKATKQEFLCSISTSLKPTLRSKSN